MSAGGGIILIIWSLELLLKTVEELNFLITFKRELEGDRKLKDALKIETKDGNFEKVDVLVENDEGIKIGFQKQKNGQYRIISGKVSDELKEKQKKLIGQIKQRYAYNLVKEELAKKGYTVVEEKNLDKNAIKIVARRWR
jgi:hypothetical protein